MEKEKNLIIDKTNKETGVGSQIPGAKKKIKLLPTFENLNLSFKAYSKNISKFAKIYFLGLFYLLIPLSVLISLMYLGTVNSLANNIIFRVFYFFIFFLSVLSLVYYSLRISISFFLLIKHNYSVRELDIYRESAHYVWSYFWLKILIGLIILFCLLFFLVTINFITTLPAILKVLIYLLSILPAFIFTVYYLLAPYILFFEDKKGIKAIKRSMELIKNYWWALAWRFLVIITIILFVEFIIYRPLLFIPSKSILTMIWNIIINIIIYLIIPFIVLFFYNIYKDLSKIKK